MTAIDKLKEVSAFLKNAGIENDAKEAELLITEALLKKHQVSGFNVQDRKWIKSKIYAGDLKIDDGTLLLIDNFAERRAHGEPLQYISGHVEFLGLVINVGKGVLIPRPETELLAEETINLLKETPPYTPLSKGGSQEAVKILDLCTGSGCIALALAKHFPHAVVYGVDMSDIALEYAVKNSKENNIQNVHFLKGDLFHTAEDFSELLKQSPISPFIKEELKDSGTIASQSSHTSIFTVHSFDCIVSNPPYVKRADIRNLQREIRDFEPNEALDGGEDGLDFYRRILKEAPIFLKEKGLLIMELGVNQSGDVMELALKAGFGNVKFVKDYASIERIFIGEAN